MPDAIDEAQAALDKLLRDKTVLDFPATIRHHSPLAAAARRPRSASIVVVERQALKAVADRLALAVLDESLPPSLRGMLPQVTCWQEALRARLEGGATMANWIRKEARHAD